MTYYHGRRCPRIRRYIQSQPVRRSPAPKVVDFCEQEPTARLHHLGWKKFMARLKEAQTNPPYRRQRKGTCYVGYGGNERSEAGLEAAV